MKGTGMEDERAREVDAFTGEDLQEMVLRLAHQVRNPLATIKSSAQLMRRLRMSAEDATPYIDSMIAQVARIDTTIKEMEQFARLEPTTAHAVLVEEVAPKVLAGLQDQARRAEVDLTSAGGPAARVLIAPEQLHLGLEHLLDNAMCFSPPGSHVTVFWETTGERLVQIHVDDQGCGVPEEHASRILRPFFSTSTNGSGLGLNVVQRICLVAGGRLEWQNRPQGGCRFTMLLPEV